MLIPLFFLRLCLVLFSACCCFLGFGRLPFCGFVLDLGLGCGFSLGHGLAAALGPGLGLGSGLCLGLGLDCCFCSILGLGRMPAGFCSLSVGLGRLLPRSCCFSPVALLLLSSKASLVLACCSCSLCIVGVFLFFLAHIAVVCVFLLHRRFGRNGLV